MAGGLSLDHPYAFTAGLMGNLISFMVYLAPLSTFYRVYRKRSTEGFQSVPYVVALFSAMLWIYYAFVKGIHSAYLLVTINSFGLVIETFYIVVFLAFAPRKARIYTAQLLFLVNVGLFGLIVLFTLVLSNGAKRIQVLGWICVGFSVSVFVAPLSIIKLVIQTKSVEFMPFNLSLFLTLSAVAWFSYGFLTKDIYVAFPNILGFSFGMVQMMLYMWYKCRARAASSSAAATEDPHFVVPESIAAASLPTPTVTTMTVKGIDVGRRCGATGDLEAPPPAMGRYVEVV